MLSVRRSGRPSIICARSDLLHVSLLYGMILRANIGKGKRFMRVLSGKKLNFLHSLVTRV